MRHPTGDHRAHGGQTGGACEAPARRSIGPSHALRASVLLALALLELLREVALGRAHEGRHDLPVGHGEVQDPGEHARPALADAGGGDAGLREQGLGLVALLPRDLDVDGHPVGVVLRHDQAVAVEAQALPVLVRLVLGLGARAHDGLQDLVERLGALVDGVLRHGLLLARRGVGLKRSLRPQEKTMAELAGME